MTQIATVTAIPAAGGPVEVAVARQTACGKVAAARRSGGDFQW